MARQLSSVYHLTGTLIAETALSVAHGDPGLTDDIVCIRDGQGRLIIPGTALAGVLRHQLGKDAQWGDERDPADPKPPQRSQPIWGSSVWVEDCVECKTGAGRAAVERRDGVGIDSFTGAAATGVLYSREVVPAGTRFSVMITVEEKDDSDPGAKDLLERIQRQLKSGISVGGATTRGLGRVTLAEKPECRQHSIGTRQGMINWLLGEPGSPVQPSGSSSGGRLLVTVPWQPTGPLLVKVAANGLADAVPLTTKSEGNVRFVVPGSSIKGVLRTRAERILRSLAPVQGQPDFSLVEFLFGSSPTRTRARRKGALTVLDCHSAHVKSWKELIERVEKARDRDDPRNDLKLARITARTVGVELIDHVAIDRWSGGSDDGRLFSLVAPTHGDDSKQGVAWDAIRLELDLSRLPADVDRTVVALLALLLRDFAEGDLPIGHGTTRGYGEVTAKLDQMTIKIEPGCPLKLASGSVVKALLSAPSGDSADAVREIQDAWASYVKHLTTAATALENAHV